MCTYDGTPYVAEQVSSILAQTVCIDELVIGDDGSTDSTLPIIKSLATGALPELRVLPVSGGLGPAANFSRTLAEAQGDVVFLADQDDVWEQSRVAVVTGYLATDPGALAVAQDPDLIDHKGAPLGKSLFDSMRVSPDELHQLNGQRAMRVVVRRNFIPGMALTVRRALLERCLPVPPSWMHDYWLVACAAALGRLRVQPSRGMLAYRQHSGNVIGAGSKGLVSRARRVLSEPNRPDVLALMFAELEDWMDRQDDVLDLARQSVRGKLEMERRRSAFGPRVWGRSRSALQLLAEGGYTTYASNGRLNVVRDLFHAPSVGEEPPHGR